MLNRNLLIYYSLVFALVSQQIITSPSFLKPDQEENKNNNLRKPIIAIVTSPQPYNDDSGHETQITWSYVRWIEDAGAKVVPLHFDLSQAEILELLHKVNGVIFQGGNRDLRLDGLYEKNALFILTESLKLNIPTWWTCEGFELLHILIAKDVNVLSTFDSLENQISNELNKKELKGSQMFRYFSPEDLDNYENPNIPSTMHLHRLGVSPEMYQKYPSLNEMLKVTSYAYDRAGKKFISTVEGKLPSMRIYSPQYHPEQIPYGYRRANWEVMNVNSVRISQKLPLQFIEDALSTLSVNNMTEKEEKKYGVFSSHTQIPNRISDTYDITYHYKNRKYSN